MSAEESDHDLLPNFDRRLESGTPDFRAAPVLARSSLAASQSQGETALRAVTKNLRVDRDAITGAPAFVGAPHEFLTGREGTGRTISAARLNRLPSSDPHRVVKAFIDEYSGIFGHGSDVLAAARVRRDYVTAHNGLRTVDWDQYLDDIQIFEASFQAHLTARGELVNVASHLVANPQQAAERGAPGRAARIASPTVSAVAAVEIAAKSVGAETPAGSLILDTSADGADAHQNFHGPTLLDAEVRYIWLPTDANTLRLCWQVICTTKSEKFMYRLVIDAESGGVHLRQGLTEHLSNASYRVFTSDSPSPFSPGLAVPSSFQPPLVSRTLVTTPALDTIASRNGWIDDGVMETRGNNVDAHTDVNADDRPDLPRPQAVGSDRVFDFPLDLTQDPSTYRDAAVVNLFYWCNFMHDKLYALGFTEAAGNFQRLNFGNGGIGNDAVQADAQDGSGTNNANFSTPPDGSSGRMQMYVFTGPTPHRDGDFDAEIILHEYTHGLSNRLVGGGVGISALQSRGMGEGWSDFYATSLLSEPNDDVNGNYASGGYATFHLAGLTQNYYFGIRRYPYSTDLKKNPLTFKDIDPAQASSHPGIPVSPIIGPTANEVHNMGEVWCVTLWEARAKLIAKHGWSAGNQLMLQLTTDGMKLSPANPNFLQARDAIIQADLVDNAGANGAELWAAFAKRGMGASSFSPSSSTTSGIVEAFDLPDDLSVTPVTPWAVSASVGGPFPTQTYTLANTGSASLSWTAATQDSWLTVDVTAGTLAPGETTTVTARFSSAAASLSVGEYTTGVDFTDLATLLVAKRVVTLSLQPPVITTVSLDSDPGWTRTGEWAFGHPAGGGGAIRGFHDPANGATGANVFGINLNGDYAALVAPAAYLTAGPYNLTGYAGTRLQFQRWLNADFFAAETVEVSRNGTTWTKVWDNASTSSAPITSNAWSKVQYDISAIADNQPTVYIRWGHQIMFGGGSPYSGWNIDDVELLGQSGAAAPVITSQPVDQKAAVGDTVVFHVSAVGLPTPTYQWKLNGLPIAGATSSALTVNNVQVGDAGAYSVTVKNTLGSVTSAAATLSGTAPIPTIVTPPADVVVKSGATAAFSVVASSTEPLTYQWRRNGFPLPGATSASLILTPVSRTDSDYYDVVVNSGLSLTASRVARLSVAPTSYVKTVGPDPAWNLQLESANGGIGYVVTPLKDGRSYVAGSFTSINGIRRSSIARVLINGAMIDASFAPPEIDDAVHALAVQADGKVIIMGDFVRVNGLLRPKLARLNVDGSLDLGFAPAFDADDQALAMVLQSDGRLLLGGSFFNYDGTNRSFLMRLNQDGSVDSSFLTLGTNGTITALALQSDGRIVVGGYFSSYLDVNGQSISRSNLERLNGNGTLDTAFNPPDIPNSSINVLASQQDGKVIVAGYLPAVGSTRTGNIARLNSDGSLDVAFTTNGGTGFSSSVNTVLVQSDGRIVVGGYFSSHAGISANSLARLNSDGTRDTTFLTLGFSFGVNGLTSQADGQILVSGGFSGYLSASSQLTPRSLFARLNTNGTLDPGWNFSIRTSGSVTMLAPAPGGKLLVGGSFNTVRGQSVPSDLLRLNVDGSIDPSFNPAGSGASSPITAATVQPDGKILISGNFFSYNGTNSSNIARLSADGGIDPSFHPGNALSGINTHALLPGGRVFVGGYFTSVSGSPRGRVAILDVNGTLEPGFATGLGANATVSNSIIQSDGKILIAGSFTSYDGVPANHIARLNADGTLDPSFAIGTGFDSEVLAMALQPDGKILLGGFFSTFNGTQRLGVARLNPNGTLDSSFNSSAGGFVTGIVVHEDGRVFLLGWFNLASSPTSSTLIRLNANGSVDTSFAAAGFAFSGSSSAAVLMRDNGQFGISSRGFASFTMTQNASAPAIVSSPSDQAVTAGETATFTVNATSLGLPLTYQWLFNGVTMPTATGSSLALSDVRVKHAGNYRVVVKNELGMVTSAPATLAVAKGQATVTLDHLAQTFDGTPRPVTVTTAPAGLPVTVAYDGNATAPTHAGNYAVTATVVDPSFDGSAAGTLKVAKAIASVEVETKSVIYDGSTKSVSATTVPAGLYLNISYEGITGTPINAGRYAVKAEVVDPDYLGSGSGVLTITPASASVTLGSLHPTYDGTPKTASVTISPAGLPVRVTYDGSTTAPTNAGSYAVAASLSDPNYTGSTSGTLTIAPGAAVLTLSGLAPFYDGTAKSVTVISNPSGLATQVTYNGNPSAPTYPGSYTVVATVVDPNYVGTVSDTLSILITALVRHAPNLNGGLDGSIQVLLPENMTFNRSAWVSGDLLVPGEPALSFNGNPILADTRDAGGNPEPSDYQVVLNDGATLRYFVSGVDPIALPALAVPPAPSGTRNVSLTRAGERVGSFATLRDLTVSGTAGPLVVPAGTYGAFTGRDGGGFTLGIEGSTTPQIYNLQSLTLGNNSRLVIRGPVVINLANGATFQASAGDAAHVGWLTLKIASGGLTLDGNITLNGVILAPAGSVTINGGATLNGAVSSDRLSINGNGLLTTPAP